MIWLPGPPFFTAPLRPPPTAQHRSSPARTINSRTVVFLGWLTFVVMVVAARGLLIAG
jgi:hypothetical protein